MNGRLEYVLYNMRDKKAFITYIGCDMQGKISSVECVVYDNARIGI
jgi:hypothetical protein